MEAINILFVKEVEKYPELFDYTKPEYSRKDVTQRAWVAVGKKFNLSGRESKGKWRNLRNSFVKNLKLLASGSTAVKKKPYYLSDAMQFTLPFLKPQGAVISGNPPDEISISRLSEIQNDDSILSDDEPQSSSKWNERFLDEPKSAKKKRVASESDEADKIAAYLEVKKQCAEAKRNAAENLSRDTEAMKKFLLSLIPDLETLSPTQRRTFKRRTLDIVEELLGENIS